MSQEAQDVQEEKINSLLLEYDDHRFAIKDMIVDLEKIRSRVDTLIPDQLDARYMRFFEEKVKSITALFNSLLEMRKEIAKSVKDEIDIRRRIKDKDSSFNIEEMVDVRSMAEKIRKFEEASSIIKKKRREKNKEQTVNKEIEIPGLSGESEDEIDGE